ncbi:MAG: hypothetical protein R2748_11385 [Bryobacterales bacterium]
MSRTRGLTLNTSYWFSKAIDTGSNYTNTASGPDARDAVSQTEFDSMRDIKALSNFDQPHVSRRLLVPLEPSRGGALGKLFGGWTLSTVFLLKTGTPFSVDSGADGPGFTATWMARATTARTCSIPGFSAAP